MTATKTIFSPLSFGKGATLGALLCASLVACGGQQTDGNSVPGQGHTASGGSEVGASDIDGELGANEVPGGDAGVSMPAGEEAPVTFVLRNSGKTPLSLNMDKGWGGVIFAYSGQPPNAKSILPFATHCTASCDSSPEEICPICEEPENVKEIKAAEQHDDVLPGDERRVPWDAMVFNYQKATGKQGNKKAKCQCSTLAEVPPETYTVKACGLRKTKTADKSSKYQCVEGTMTLPADGPVVVELDFGIPE